MQTTQRHPVSLDRFSDLSGLAKNGAIRSGEPSFLQDTHARFGCAAVSPIESAVGRAPKLLGLGRACRAFLFSGLFKKEPNMNATVLFVLAAFAGLPATTPTDDLINVTQIVRREPDRKWSNYRVVSFSNLPQAERQRVKGDVQFFVETLNRVTERAEIIELNDALWAINVAAMKWKAKDWDDMAKKWPYYETPRKIKTHLRAVFNTESPVVRADAFVREAWEPEWYTKFLNLPTKREKLLAEHGLKADWPKEIQAIGVIPNSEVQNNPRKVAYLTGKSQGRARDFFVTMNYEDQRGKNNSLRFPSRVDCNYNEIAVEMPNGLDFYYANAGGGGVASKPAITDELVDRLGNGDSRMGGLVKQIPLRAGVDHVHDGQIMLGMSCLGCHAGGAQDLTAKLAKLSELRFDDSKLSPERIAELYDNGELAAKAGLASRRWQAALRSINGRSPEDNQRSWQATFASFGATVDLNKAALETGTSQSNLRGAISRWLERNSDPLMAAILDRAISREEFEQIFATLCGLFGRADERAVENELRSSTASDTPIRGRFAPAIEADLISAGYSPHGHGAEIVWMASAQ
jgi:hypothetical protein